MCSESASLLCYSLSWLATFSPCCFLLYTGIVGSWRDLFSKAQNEEMDRKFEDSIGRTKLAAKIKYNVYCKAWKWAEEQQLLPQKWFSNSGRSPWEKRKPSEIDLAPLNIWTVILGLVLCLEPGCCLMQANKMSAFSVSAWHPSRREMVHGHHSTHLVVSLWLPHSLRLWGRLMQCSMVRERSLHRDLPPRT